MLSYQFYNIRRTQFDLSSPVQPISDFRGGPLSITQEESGQRTEILVFNIGYLCSCVVFSILLCWLFEGQLKSKQSVLLIIQLVPLLCFIHQASTINAVFQDLKDVSPTSAHFTPTFLCSRLSMYPSIITHPRLKNYGRLKEKPGQTKNQD